MKEELAITKYSHHFSVSRISVRSREAVMKFSKGFIQWKSFKRGQRFIREMDRVFATALEDRSEFRFHINQLEGFKKALQSDYITPSMYSEVEEPMFETVKIELPFKPEFSDLAEQVPVIEYLTDVNGQLRSKFVGIQTGKGKSYCALRAGAYYGERIVLVVKPSFIPKWIGDIHKHCNVPNDEIMGVAGSDQLMALQHLAATDTLDARVILISNKTLQNWFKLYKRWGEGILDQGYACVPHDLMKLLKAGTRISDEVHLDFHLNFLVDLYTHINRTISLSATMINDDGFLTKMYDVAWPTSTRFVGGAYDRYINGYSVFFRLKEPEKIRTTERGSPYYSHNVFEQSILKYKEMTRNYVNLVKMVMDTSYMEDRKPGDKCIVFCASVAMCSYMTNEFKKLYPTLDVRRYVEDDPYENLMEADLRFTTLGSAGTGHDIPQLSTTVLTHAISSSQTNVQGLGRLRKLADGRSPKFFWFVCHDVSKHIDYHERKLKLLDGRLLNYKSMETGIAV